MGTIKIECVLQKNEGEEFKKEEECKSFDVTKEKELGREQKKGACKGNQCWFEKQDLQLWQPKDKILPHVAPWQLLSLGLFKVIFILKLKCTFDCVATMRF
jgi:hypothetical protein